MLQLKHIVSSCQQLLMGGIFFQRSVANIRLKRSRINPVPVSLQGLSGIFNLSRPGNVFYIPFFKITIIIMCTSTRSSIPPVIIQHYTTGEILMIGYMDSIAYSTTLQTGYVSLYDPKTKTTSENGAACGHKLEVREFFINNCESCILVKVIPQGLTCRQCIRCSFTKARLKT